MGLVQSDLDRTNGTGHLSVLDPRGYIPEVELIPLSPRVGDLND